MVGARLQRMRRLNLKAFHVPIVAACRKTAFGGILGCGNYCLDVCRCIQVVGQPSVSVYKSGTKCSEPDNGTALLSAICQPPGHAFKQIVQVC